MKSFEGTPGVRIAWFTRSVLEVRTECAPRQLRNGKMSRMDLAGIALAVSLLSALFAGLAWRETRKQAIASRDMVTIEHRRDADAVEHARAARVVPEIVRERDEKGRMRSRLQVVNKGDGIARSVTVVLEQIEGEEGHLPRFFDNTFPCDLPADHKADVPLTVVLGSVPRVLLISRWTDDRGPQEERFVTPIH